MAPEIEILGGCGRSWGPLQRPGGRQRPPGGLLGGMLAPSWLHFSLFWLHVLVVLLLPHVLLFFSRSAVMFAFCLRLWPVAVWHLGFSSEVPSFSSEVSGFSSAVFGLSSGVSIFSSDTCFLFCGFGL